jgi:hypothetical protein
MSLRVAVLPSQAEVNHVDLVASLADTHKEVVRFDITMDKRLSVDVLDSREELIDQKEDSLQREFSVAEVEEIFQTGTKKVEDHDIVVTFATEPTDEGNAESTSERLIDTSFALKLRMLGLHRFELDGNLFAGDNVCAQVDVTETTASDLPTNTILIADAEILQRQDQYTDGRWSFSSWVSLLPNSFSVSNHIPSSSL